MYVWKNFDTYPDEVPNLKLPPCTLLEGVGGFGEALGNRSICKGIGSIYSLHMHEFNCVRMYVCMDRYDVIVPVEYLCRAMSSNIWNNASMITTMDSGRSVVGTPRLGYRDR